MRRASHTGAALLALVIAGATGEVRADTAVPEPATAHVTYLAGRSVYIDAGRDDGLLPGATVQLVREGRVVATLRVEYLSTHRAACSIVAAQNDPVVGDTARYTPARGSPPGV